MGIEDLLESINLVAEMQELKANPNRLAKGTVIEARLDKGMGPIATVLVQNGTLHTGDIIVAGTSVGRVRSMMDDKGRRVKEAGPSVPVEITGLDDVPVGGDIFNAVSDERLARELVEQRRTEQKEEVFRSQTKVTLDNLFEQMKGVIRIPPRMQAFHDCRMCGIIAASVYLNHESRLSQKRSAPGNLPVFGRPENVLLKTDFIECVSFPHFRKLKRVCQSDIFKKSP